MHLLIVWQWFPSLQRLQRLFASELQTEESTTAASLPHNCRRSTRMVAAYSAPRNTAKYRGIVDRCQAPRSPASKSNGVSSRRFQIAESMGFKGDFRQWEDLLRAGD